MERISAWRKKNGLNESNWSKHAHCTVYTHKSYTIPTNRKNHQQKASTDTFIATAIKLRRFVCHSQGIYSISQVQCLHTFCVEMFRSHFMKLNASNVAFVKWIFSAVSICSIRAHTLHIHTYMHRETYARMRVWVRERQITGKTAYGLSRIVKEWKTKHTHGQNETYYN